MKEDKYTQGYGEFVTALHGSRTVESHAQFVLPYLKANMKVLDCGCGPGSISLGLAREVRSGFVTAVEIDEGQLEFGRQKAKEQSIENVEFCKASIYELPFLDNTFDLVFISAVLGNLTDIENALKEIHRVLKPNGILAIREFDYNGRLVFPEPPLIKKTGCILR